MTLAATMQAGDVPAGPGDEGEVALMDTRHGYGRRSQGRRARVAALALAAMWAVTACDPVPSQRTPTYDPTIAQSADAVVLTGPTPYAVSASPGAALFTVPAGMTADARTLWVPDGPGTVVEDAEACATFVDVRGGLTQPGLAFRVRQEPGRLRGITVTQNAMYGVRWWVNVHVWDTDFRTAAGDPEPAIVQGFDLTGGVSRPDGTWAPLPWRLCSRVYGRTLELKMWATEKPEPAWGTKGSTGKVVLDPQWDAPGRTGWFGGHLGSDGRLDLRDLRAWSLTSPS